MFIVHHPNARRSLVNVIYSTCTTHSSQALPCGSDRTNCCRLCRSGEEHSRRIRFRLWITGTSSYRCPPRGRNGTPLLSYHPYIRYDRLVSTAVLVLGTLIVAIGVLGALMPRQLLGLASSRLRGGALPVTFTARLTVGVVLVSAAGDTLFPLTFRVLGYISLATAAAIPLVGGHRIEAFRRHIATGCPPTLVRLGGAALIGFGSFLFYAVV